MTRSAWETGRNQGSASSRWLRWGTKWEKKNKMRKDGNMSDVGRTEISCSDGSFHVP